MIKHSIHIALIFLLSVSGFAQQQDLFYQILTEVKNNPQTDIIETYASQIKNDALFAENLALALDAEGEKFAAFEIAALHQNSIWASLFLARNAALQNDAETACAFLSKHMRSKNRALRSEIRSCSDFDPIRNSDEWKNLWYTGFYNATDISYESALNYYNNTHYQWALEEINALIQQFPNRHAYYALRAKIYLKLEQGQQAIRDIETALSTYSRNADYYLIAAEAYAETGNERKALSALESAEKINPYNFAAKKQQIKIAQQIGAQDMLIQFASAYAAFTDDVESLYMIAEAEQKRGNHTDAIVLMNKVLEKSTSKAEYFIVRADAFMATRSWTNAMKDYAMALDINPNLPQVYINYGICRLENGDREGACYLWKRALHYKHSQANQYLYKWCE
jgi:tetratricopeptide (TPR) repeat protein